MSSIVLTKTQKMGSISYDELMNSLTEDLDQNYELMKRYILYNQLMGSGPINIANFIDEDNKKSSMLAIRTLLKYGKNPNSRVKIVNIKEWSQAHYNNYLSRMLALNFEEKDIYEAIDLGLKNGLNINDRFDEHSSYFEIYYGSFLPFCDVRSSDCFLTRIRTNYDLSGFFEHLCKKGFSFRNERKGLRSLEAIKNGCSGSEGRYDKNDCDKVISLYKNWEQELKKNAVEKENELDSVLAYQLNIKGITYAKFQNEKIISICLWGMVPLLLELMTDDLAENFRIIEKFCDVERIATPDGYKPSIQDFLMPEYEKQSLLAVKTLLKNKYHPNVISLPSNAHKRTCLYNSKKTDREDFIFWAVKEGFSENFIIEAINEALKYGYDINTICLDKDLMTYIILSKKYKGKITPIYKFLCENGYDSTLNYGLLKTIDETRKKGKIFDSADIKLFEEMYNEEILKVKKFLGIVKAEKDSLEPTERTSEKELPFIGKDYYDLLSNLSKQELEILSLKFKYKDEISNQDIAKLLSIDEKVVNDVLNKIKNLYIDEKEQKPITRAKTRSFQEK